MRVGFVGVLLAATLSFHSEARAEDVRATARRFAAEDGFNGVVLVGRGRHVESLQTFGFADAEAGVKVAAKTRFETGSLSKWVASLVVLKLVDEGGCRSTRPSPRTCPTTAPTRGPGSRCAG